VLPCGSCHPVLPSAQRPRQSSSVIVNAET
jgi:hypothetical protein